MEIQELLEQTNKRGASDLHLMAGYQPTLRIDGELTPIRDKPVLSSQETERLVFSILTSEQKELFLANKELDFSFAFSEARFRVNVYFQQGEIAVALRLIPFKIRTIDELNLPPICHTFASLRQGFILVTGPTGHGKSTTLAAIINEINQNRPCHIVTIEDPIEYVYPRGQAIISQREMHLDTHSWEVALRSCLREDPDVVLVGEMRDYETIAAALTIAETGHLVFATLHTNSAAQTVDRIVDVFPEHAKSQVRAQFSATLEGILSERLVPAIEGGRIPACEILVTTPAVRTTIREGKTHLIDNIIQTSGGLGMISLEGILARLVKTGKITTSVAEDFALRPEELERLLRGRKGSP
ncbi:type IV pilus twitching motility protein PilT [Candidatus Gottesmanbacteria bacterium]|nr:type IV pilus twitching motility protein PilT [Candidatus Gottesmanbacteria bacterium]MBI5465395.1 type IV pilus twitching motility protein PilT [Candidatus Gottesmanbacteria bacterium]